MRRISKLRQRKLSIFEHKKFLRKKRRQQKLKEKISNTNSGSREGDFINLIPPTIMSLKNNYDETVKFLFEFRAAVLPTENHNKTVSVNLENINDISIPVAIILAAEFHRWSLVKKVSLNPRKTGHWCDKLLNLFSDLGVFELLGVPPRLPRGNIASYALSPLESGLAYEGEKIYSLQTRFENDVENFASVNSVYEGSLEAVENAIDHAYPEDYEFIHQHAGHRWWAASCLDMDTNELRFFVFDQGAGIPSTLPRQGIFESVFHTFSELQSSYKDDGIILKKAFEVSRSQTGQEERGKGLEKMRSVAEAGPNCKFRILSGHGEINYKNGGVIENSTHLYHIGGTLIEWSFPTNLFESNISDEKND